MKRISFFLVLASLVVSFGLANAVSISVDNVTSTYGTPDSIIAGAPVVFTMRYTNDRPYTIGGIDNAWKVYTMGGGSFTIPVIDTLPWPGSDGGGWTTGDHFALIFAFTSGYGANDGAGADTVGVGGAKSTGYGLPIGFDAPSVTIATGNIAEGETLCIDSTWAKPNHAWVWAPGGGNPSEAPEWGGPYCYIAGVPPCQPPVIDNAPTSLTGSHCDVMTFDFDAHEVTPQTPPNPITGWTASIGTIDANGVWSYSPTLADVGASVSVDIVATGAGCNSAVSTVNLNFTNEAPVVTCPGDVSMSNGTGATVSATATDDCDPVTFTLSDAAAFLAADAGNAVTVDPNGTIHLNAGQTGGTWPITVEGSDGNLSSTCTFDVTVIIGSQYQVVIPCVGDQSGNFVFQGQHVIVPVQLAAQGGPIGGYDMLIAYDNSALSFQTASIGDDWGPAGCGWEYFTYRYGADGNCSGSCPSGLLRVTAIAETNNGPNHPSCFEADPKPSTLFNLDFLVTNDRTFQCQVIPIRFFWLDCGDNALSTASGDSLLIAEHIYTGDASLNPPNGIDIIDGTVGYPTYQGPQDGTCGSGAKTAYPAVSFQNGCINIACSDSIDARGDINLNNVKYEIADAVLFSNYFVYGIGVFHINLQGQIAATDVNNDGLTLSVADLVYLIRVIQGDALPYPKLAPASITYTADGGNVVVNGTVGAALVTYQGDVTPVLHADNMELKYAFDREANVTHALVFSMEGNTFNGNVLSANGNVISSEFASVDGATVNAKLLPANFSLAQNYPNPFNPTTTIGFSLPVKAQVSLSIYNIAGQLVKTFDGSFEAGEHSFSWDASAQASGVYFYKLTANNFSETKKMVLLK